MPLMNSAIINRAQFNLLNRLGHLEKGKRYIVLLDVSEAGEMCWTVTELGKVERPTPGREAESVVVRIR